MKKIIVLILLGVFAMCAACGAKPDTAAANKSNSTTTENKTTGSSNSASSTTAAGSPSAVVKEIYDHAVKRDGKAILPLLTKEFRDGVGSDSKDNMDALCDSFTDSSKLTSFEVKDEKVTGDTATVTVSLTYKDGKKEDKTEKMKKADGKWLMDS